MPVKKPKKTRTRKRKATRKKGSTIPLKLLEKRAQRLTNIVRSRGGKGPK